MTVADRIAAAFGYVRRPWTVEAVYADNGLPPAPVPTPEGVRDAVRHALTLGEPVGLSVRTSGPKNRDLHIDLTFRHKGTVR